MAKLITSLMKLAVTVGASALGAGPLSSLSEEIALPVLKSLLGEKVTDNLAAMTDDVLGNLAGDFAKEAIDALHREPPQGLQRLYVQALRKALIVARDKFRREYGTKLLFNEGWELPDEQERFFTACLAKLESLYGDRIDLEIVFHDQPALDEIFTTDHQDSTGWKFLSRNLADWGGQNGIPSELEEHLRRDLLTILTDQFSTLLSLPHFQEAFRKYQAHFTQKIYQSVSELHEIANRANESIGELKEITVQSSRKLDRILDLIQENNHARIEAAGSEEPPDLAEFRNSLIRKWSQPQYRLDKRFVRLTLMIDQGKDQPQRWQRQESRFMDLRDVLQVVEERDGSRVVVLLGAPGSGKSTLLRRLQLDHSFDRFDDGIEEVSFFVPLNDYRAPQNGVLPDPQEWLESRWRLENPGLPSLKGYLNQGRVLLLLDALNEMPQKSDDDYLNLVAWWRSFVQRAAGCGNRLVFSCRSLDYSAPLSGDGLTVPQIDLLPMNEDQLHGFLRAYVPEHESRVWAELKKSPEQLDLFKTPYFLKLLCDQVEELQDFPKGRAGLFTGFVRHALRRERSRNAEIFNSNVLLDRDDRLQLNLNSWSSGFDLPETGELIPRLSLLAFSMQDSRQGTQNAQVRISKRDARRLIAHERADEILRAGEALNVLDEDTSTHEVLFYHQLLQEYFAARKLAREPDPTRVHVEWSVDRVSPTLDETLKGLADGDPLPPQAQTGWEETTLTAAPMARDAEAFIRDLIPHNLPLAARCAASPEVGVGEKLKNEIREGLIARTRDMSVDLRARIAAGEALGIVGDPRFELRQGPFGDYLMPPLVEIPAGTYPIGDNNGSYDDEKPAHTVDLPAFRIGMFPVTNAEYEKFIEAEGYQNEQWWDTLEALKWLREGGNEGRKQGLREYRQALQEDSEENIRDMVRQNQATSEEVEFLIAIRNGTDEEFEKWLEVRFPSGKLYRQPEFWDDVKFNIRSQPVVGVTWFEARAYCNWLTANVGDEGRGIFRLPSEVEFEAAARGKKGRLFPYGNEFEVSRCNTFESHIRRSTPVGIFDNATPEGAYDLSGNVYTWTLSIYDQDKFPYEYQIGDEREDIKATEVRRVLRGGSWLDDLGNARAVYRLNYGPHNRYDDVGWRVVSCVRPPSL